MNTGDDSQLDGATNDPWRVDAHSHIMTDAYMAEILDRMPTMYGQLWPDWSEASALERMDRWNIAAQVVSLTEPALRLIDADRRAEVARRCNEEMAELVRAHPSRFGALATVPLFDNDEAVTEIEYALDELGLDGVGLLSSQDGVYLGDPSMDPIMEALDKRGCWVLIHPAHAASTPDMPVPPMMMEFPFDLTRAAVNLLVHAIPVRFPSIRWFLVQAGGTLPFLAPRISAFMAMPEPMKIEVGMPPQALQMTSEDMLEGTKKFFFDTAIATGPTAMRPLRELTAFDHILYGSDLPFGRYAMGEKRTGIDPSPELSETFTNSERRGIERDNALAQFPRLGAELAKAEGRG